MDFAQFIVQHVPLDKKTVEDMQSCNEKIGDYILQKKIIERRVLTQLLAEFAQTEAKSKKDD